ncbi:hypothetical protein SLE2022_386040 [Rubroshorea leprosula]
MKACSIMAAIALLLSVLLSTWLSSVRVEGRPVPVVQSLSTSSTASSSQTLGGFPAEEKNAYEQDNRQIPPSTSNPIQNKTKPPSVGRKQNKSKIPRKLILFFE